jgi:hypothetical protein
MKSFKILLVAIFAFVAVAGVPTASLSIATPTKIELKKSSHSIIAQAYADEVAASPSPEVSPAPAQSSGVGKVGEFLADLASKIPLEGVIISILVFVYDFVRRRMPTKNPASLLRDVQKLLKGVIAMFMKLDQLLDKVLGQNVKS